MNSSSILLKRILLILAFMPVIAIANNSLLLSTNSQYSVGLDLGLAKPTNIGSPTTFPLGYSTFSYGSNTNNAHSLISGIFISKVLAVIPLYTLQVGVSAHYLSSMSAKGNLAQGVSQPYYQSTYTYSINSYQYNIDAKLSHEIFNRYFPYVYLGFGIACNRAYNYSTSVPDYLTVTPEYSSKTTNSFAYSLGVGADCFAAPKLSIGLGYRFINLGKVGLGSGMIRNTNVSAHLTQSDLYINTLLAQLNYFL